MKCTLCGKKIIGRHAFLNAKPYHPACQTKEKYQRKNAETEKRRVQWIRSMAFKQLESRRSKK